MTLALGENAVENEVEFKLGLAVIDIKREDNGKDINRNGFVSVLFFITK